MGKYYFHGTVHSQRYIFYCGCTRCRRLTMSLAGCSATVSSSPSWWSLTSSSSASDVYQSESEWYRGRFRNGSCCRWSREGRKHGLNSNCKIHFARWPVCATWFKLHSIFMNREKRTFAVKHFKNYLHFLLHPKGFTVNQAVSRWIALVRRFIADTVKIVTLILLRSLRKKVDIPLSNPDKM